METKFIRALVALGIPGVALGVFYLLFRVFNFQFSPINSTYSAAIALIFILVVGVIIFYALHRWAPVRMQQIPGKNSKPFEYKVKEETITYTEKMTSLAFDVVKVNAHTHQLGVDAEYAWIAHKYPTSKFLGQSITTLELITGKSGGYEPGQVFFDVIKIRLPDGREKDIYFDIGSFVKDFISSDSMTEFVKQKISELYQ